MSTKGGPIGAHGVVKMIIVSFNFLCLRSMLGSYTAIWLAPSSSFLGIETEEYEKPK